MCVELDICLIKSIQKGIGRGNSALRSEAPVSIGQYLVNSSKGKTPLLFAHVPGGGIECVQYGVESFLLQATLVQDYLPTDLLKRLPIHASVKTLLFETLTLVQHHVLYLPEDTAMGRHAALQKPAQERTHFRSYIDEIRQHD